MKPVRMEFFDGNNEKDAEAAHKEHKDLVSDVFRDYPKNLKLVLELT